jgi:hypothetical protein
VDVKITSSSIRMFSPSSSRAEEKYIQTITTSFTSSRREHGKPRFRKGWSNRYICSASDSKFLLHQSGLGRHIYLIGKKHNLFLHPNRGRVECQVDRATSRVRRSDATVNTHTRKVGQGLHHANVRRVNCRRLQSGKVQQKP